MDQLPVQYFQFVLETDRAPCGGRNSVQRSSSLDVNLPSAEKWHPERVQSLADMEDFLGRLLTILHGWGYGERDQFCIRLALEEAIVNAIRHGHGNDASKTVHIRHHLSPEQIFVSIEDQGPGFDPNKVPDPLAPENLDRPSGRGVFLIRHYMTWAKYNERGNGLILCKKKTI